MFCFPTGIVLREDMELPSFFTFVLTDPKGVELYGSCLTFYEPETREGMIAPLCVTFQAGWINHFGITCGWFCVLT
jgi:hypothetical protein